MSTTVPAQLKSADIQRFVTRANQLEKAKPVISYWCNFWVVKQIVSKRLHLQDKECEQFSEELMNKLEKFKSENADNDAIIDDVAGQAYVEQFALETFERADNAIRANKATLQTADTFQAAATFMELCQIWGQLEAEAASKIKFAKYHALRIVKAVKAGEDPNESNPSTETQNNEDAAEGIGPSAGQNGPEISVSQAPSAEDGPQQRPRQASVEEVPDDFDSVQRRLAQQSTLDESIHPSRSSSAAPAARPEKPSPSNPPSTGDSPTMFPTGMMDMDSGRRQRPSHLSQAAVPDLPAAPSDFPSPSSSPAGTPQHRGGPPDAFPPVSTFQSFPPPAATSQPPQTSFEAPPSHLAPSSRGHNPHAQQPPATSVPPTTGQAPPRSVPPGQVHGGGAGPGPNVDDEAITKAQKHARWAVSALNFDDVNTAVNELRNALGFLGAN